MDGVGFAALGTTAHLLVDDPAALAEAEAVLRAFLADLDRACSRFRSDSALSELNARRSGSGLDPLLYGALEAAMAVAEETGGLTVPSMGACLVAVGYDRTFADMPADVGAVRPLPGPGWRGIRLDPATRAVRLPDGVRLDLGATAKAWGADRAAALLAERFGCAVLVNLGGDVAVAGTALPWRVRVADDHRASGGGQVVTIRSGGVATSSTAVRAWRGGGEVLHHILDPLTGMPARRVWRTVSVTARTCAAANAAATAAVVLGERAPAWLAALDLPARLVAPDRTVTRVAGWPAEALEAA
ncbi:FAD:protein FMN transferase [Actinokineospora sp. 24-640]